MLVIDGIKKISLSEYFGVEKIPKKLGILSNSCFSLIHKRPFLVLVNNFPGFSSPSNIMIRSLPSSLCPNKTISSPKKFEFISMSNLSSENFEDQELDEQKTNIIIKYNLHWL